MGQSITGNIEADGIDKYSESKMSEPTIDEISATSAPIFWAYGLAVYHAQLIENGVQLLLLVIAYERKKEGLSVSDLSIDNPRHIENTLGKLFNKARKHGCFTKEDERKVRKAINTRNLLVHAYWRKKKHIKAISTPKGREWLVSNLLKLKEQCREADRIITALIDQYLSLYGTSIEALSPPIPEIWQSDEEPPDHVLH